MRRVFFWRFGDHEVTAKLGWGSRFEVAHDGKPMGRLNAFFHWGEVAFVAREGRQDVPYRVRILVLPYADASVEIHRDGALVVGRR